ncbi:hypothetical protein TKK_0006012 [Trichogramma kaykai]|uniref:Chemosensory protein n=1 Tax=Trichogramma kaykai TaxID=54128 RepID=A0ABD2XEK7_9HYME
MSTKCSYYFLLVLVALVALSSRASAQSAIDSMLQNRAFVERQISCITRNGPCDPIGKLIIRRLPDVLHNNCSSCNPFEKQAAENLIRFMQQNYPQEWARIRSIY